MAKKKTGKASRKPAAKRAKAKKRGSKKVGAAKALKPKAVDLKHMRTQLELCSQYISAKIATSTAPMPKLEAAQSKLARMAADIDDICDDEMQELCGPTMLVPAP